MNAKTVIVIEDEELADPETIKFIQKLMARESRDVANQGMRRFFNPRKIKFYRSGKPTKKNFEMIMTRKFTTPKLKRDRKWGEGSRGPYSKEAYQQMIMRKAA